jgi:hypothetical protein
MEMERIELKLKMHRQPKVTQLRLQKVLQKMIKQQKLQTKETIVLLLKMRKSLQVVELAALVAQAAHQTKLQQNQQVQIQKIKIDC